MVYMYVNILNLVKDSEWKILHISHPKDINLLHEKKHKIFSTFVDVISGFTHHFMMVTNQMQILVQRFGSH